MYTYNSYFPPPEMGEVAWHTVLFLDPEKTLEIAFCADTFQLSQPLKGHLH